MQTVIGVFDELRTAQDAQERLWQSGFARERVHLAPGHMTASGEVVTDAEQADPRGKPENRNVLAALGGFWANLVESHNVHAEMLSQAVRRGSTVVLAEVPTLELAEQARTLLRECGAAHIQQSEQEGGPGGAQPWHAADEGREPAAGRSAPLGTHSLTGGGMAVGIAGDRGTESVTRGDTTRDRAREPERSAEHATARAAEPRAGAADLLGRKRDER